MPQSKQSAARSEHLWILGIALVAIGGSFVLQPAGHGGLYVSVPGLDARITFPESCMSRRLLGLSCPGCGLTRSFVALARGQVKESFCFNPMGPVLFAVCCFQLPYRIIEFLGLWRAGRWWSAFRDVLALGTWVLLVSLVVGWAARMAGLV
jgi:hypothetical protein